MAPNWETGRGESDSDKLFEVDATLIDLRVACMETSILNVLEKQRPDTDDFFPCLRIAPDATLTKISQAGGFSDFSKPLSDFLAITVKFSHLVLPCMTASQKRINKNEFETLKQDIVKPHAEWSIAFAPRANFVVHFVCPEGKFRGPFRLPRGPSSWSVSVC